MKLIAETNMRRCGVVSLVKVVDHDEYPAKMADLHATRKGSPFTPPTTHDNLHREDPLDCSSQSQDDKLTTRSEWNWEPDVYVVVLFVSMASGQSRVENPRPFIICSALPLIYPKLPQMPRFTKGLQTHTLSGTGYNMDIMECMESL